MLFTCTMMSERLINPPKYIFFLILILGKLSSEVESIRFEVKSGGAKCIGEEINKDSITVGKYHIVKQNEAYPLPDSHKLNVQGIKVKSDDGKKFHQADNVTEGNFMFHTGEEDEEYLTCFYAPDHEPPVTLTIEFEWKSGIAAKDWSSVAKKDSVEAMVMRLKEMFDIAHSIYDEASNHRERGEEGLMINIATNNEIALLSFLSVVICASVAGLQFRYLKSFFEKTKLI